MRKFLPLLLLFTFGMFGTAAYAQYCLPTYNSQCTSGDFINTVVFNTINNANTGCGTPSANNYTDYSSTISTVVNKNTPYTISASSGPSWGQYHVAFIDLNGDFDFADPGEFFDIGYAAAGATVSNTITIPATATATTTRLRVMCRFGTGALTAADYCATGLTWGECEDYEVVLFAPANDAGVCAIDSPATPACNLDSLVYVSIANFGTDTLDTCQVMWSVNGVMQPQYHWSGPLNPGDKDSLILIGTYPFIPGDLLKVWTSMPNDSIEPPLGASNDTMSVVVALGLSGTMTIGSPGADYANFTAAVNDLLQFGVCGNVTFDVHDSTYNEQLTLGEVAGAGPNSWITFRSASGNKKGVILRHLSSGPNDNFVVDFNGADYFRFQDMTITNGGTSYAWTLLFHGGANWNEINGCWIAGDTLSTSTSTNRSNIYSPTTNSIDNNNAFLNNCIQGGSYGMYWTGDGATSLESGTMIDGNQFLNNTYYSLRCYYQDAPQVSNNWVNGHNIYTGTSYAMYFGFCDNSMQVYNNTVASGDNDYYPRYGMYFTSCDGNTQNPGWIYNNMISVGDNASNNLYYGCYFTGNGYANFHHNNIRVAGPGTNSRAIYWTGGGACEMMNNNLVNVGSGLAAYFASSFAVTASDYNNLYSNGTVLAFFNANEPDLSSYQASSGYDGNSVSVDPGYHSDTDLHVCNDTLDNAGTPIANITTDIDGAPRDISAPDIGADEFSGFANFSIGPDVSLCIGDSITLFAGSPSDTVMWSTGDTTNSIVVSAAGTYTVSVQGACGTAMDTLVVSAAADVYSGYLVADTSFACAGDSITLSSTMSADTYTWSTGATTPSIKVGAGGTYTLDITDGCGSGSESISVSVVAGPTASFTATTSFLTCIFTNTSTNGGGNNTYSWDFGDGNSSTLEHPIHPYATSGIYPVTLTVTNECGTETFTDTCNVAVTGLAEFAAGQVAIYPNPNQGLFNVDVELNATDNLVLTVLDVAGQAVYRKEFSQVNRAAEAIDLRANAAGMYFVRIQSGDVMTVRKVVVK